MLPPDCRAGQIDKQVTSFLQSLFAIIYFRKEASRLRLFIRVPYTQQLRGSGPLLPTIHVD
jgi:hypothetical protein